jgi:glutamate-5-semialdehyde dehydrogenase
MSITEIDLRSYCQETATAAKLASRKIASLPTETKNRWLSESAIALRKRTEEILEANQADLNQASEFELTAAQIDRLRLTRQRIEDIARALDEIAAMEDPIGQVISTVARPNGLKIQKVRAPLGVIFFIYESRPNVTVDAAAICIKSGNAVILRSGKEAANSSRALLRVLQDVAIGLGIPEAAMQLVQTADRAAVQHFLSMKESIDLAIPRGGEGLIRLVAEHATMPVLKHYAGNCHVYVDRKADLKKAEQIIVNAKCQRPGVCNACESLVIHQNVAAKFVPQIAKVLHEHKVEIVGDEASCQLSQWIGPASDDDYATEYLELKISLRIVPDIERAIEHINHFGSGHTDAIITEDAQAADRFAAEVDSSAVMINASTRFNDGGEFGIGAEIGISTDKFHARGPCGVNELTIYKYVCHGDGQTR